ncbi:MAG: hypothetical protein QF881_07560, partial [Acidimicrobiales bacterium]|nr:hypothetical protein [Acidimicrobiales bacterium]
MRTRRKLVALLTVVGLLAAPSVTPVAAQDAEAPTCEARPQDDGSVSNWCDDGTGWRVDASGNRTGEWYTEGDCQITTNNDGTIRGRC